MAGIEYISGVGVCSGDQTKTGQNESFRTVCFTARNLVIRNSSVCYFRNFKFIFNN